MVKIKELSEKEINERKLESALVDLVRRRFQPSAGFRVNEIPQVGISVSHDGRSAVYIKFLGSEMLVKSPDYLDTAVRLAEDYETILGKDKVTVKKEWYER